MATLTLTVGASTDDASLMDGSGYQDSNTTESVGACGNSPTPTDSGQGWRYTAVTLAAADTINSAFQKLMKDTTEFSQHNNRWTCEAADNATTFSVTVPPGQRAIVATIIVDQTNILTLDVTVYNYPNAGADQTSYGAAIANVTGRAGWASGNALNLINQSKQDAGQNTGFSRKSFHTWDSATASSEPQLVIDYTAGAAASASASQMAARQGQRTGYGVHR